MERIKTNLTLCPYINENNTNCMTIPRIQLSELETAKITCNNHEESYSQNFEISNYLTKNNNNINGKFYCSICLMKLREDHFFFYCDACKKFYCVKCKNNSWHNHQLSKRSFSTFWNKCMIDSKDYTKYCKTCFISFCEDCDMLAHKNHEMIDINIKNEKEINEIKNNLQIQVNYFEKVKKIMLECLDKMENKLKLKKQILNNYNENKRNGNSIENLNEISVPLNQSYKQKIDDLTKSNNFKDKILALDYFYEMCSPKIDNNNNNSNINSRNVSNNHSQTYKNQKLYPTVINHRNINRDLVDIINVGDDGNCFYRAISYFLNNNENSYSSIREEIYQEALKNQRNNPQKLEIIENNQLSVTQYIDHIRKDGIFAGDLEISTAKELYNINIATYRPGTKNEFSFINFYCDGTNYNKDLLILIYINNNHYQLAYYKNKEEKKSESKSNEEIIGIQKLKKEIKNKSESSFINNNSINNINNLRNKPTPKSKNSPKKNEKYKNAFELEEKSVINSMIRLSSGNLALGLSNGLIKIYDVDNICSMNNNYIDDEDEEMDTLLTIKDFKGKRINYLYELKDKTLLCATYSKIHHIKLVNNDKEFEYIGTINLSKRELPKRIIELGNEIIVSLGEKVYKKENITRKKCLLKVFNRNSVSKSEDNSFCILSDKESINSCNSNFEEYSNIYSSGEEDSLKESDVNDKQFKNDINYILYKNNENKDKIYLCSMFPIELGKENTNDFLYHFIATSNRLFYEGVNCVQLYGIYKRPDGKGFTFFIDKTFDNISCSRMVDSICKINETYIGIGLQQYQMDCDNGIALFNYKKKEIEKTIKGLSIGLLKKSINKNNYIFFTTNKTKDMKINNELRLFNRKDDKNKNNEYLSKDKDKLIFSINSCFSCLVELIPSIDASNRKKIYYVASYDKKFYVIIINNTE